MARGDKAADSAPSGVVAERKLGSRVAMRENSFESIHSYHREMQLPPSLNESQGRLFLRGAKAGYNRFQTVHLGGMLRR